MRDPTHTPRFVNDARAVASLGLPFLPRGTADCLPVLDRARAMQPAANDSPLFELALASWPAPGGGIVHLYPSGRTEFVQ